VQKLVEKRASKEKIGLRGPMPPGVLFAVYDSKTGNPDYIPPEYCDIQGLLDELIEYVNTTDDHPLIVAAVVHYQLVTIHPFEDGNGRTARLLSGYIMDLNGYGFNGVGSLEEYYQEAGRGGRDEKKAFAVALCSSTDSAKLKKRLADEFPDKEFIYRVYEALGNYYQIAVGYGLDTVHDFSLTDFCSAYKFSLLQAHHALKILGLSGYIEYTEEVDNASRLMFTATRDELYRYLSENKRTDEVIQTILRSYTGLFADYVYIDESVIATRARVTPHEVYETLAGLSRYRIVNYIPHKKTPLIIYTQTREEQRYLSIPRSAYEERKERFGKRIEKVLEYINEERVCRSRMLLSYFGEEDSAPCGCCDVCLSKHESQLMNWEFSAIRESLVKVLAGESPIPVKELIEKLPFPQEKSLTAIRFLADQDPRFTLSDGYLSHEDSAK